MFAAVLSGLLLLLLWLSLWIFWLSHSLFYFISFWGADDFIFFKF